MSERAIFDVRIWVTAESRADVWDTISELEAKLRALQIPGVDVRYSQLRRNRGTRGFEPTMERRRKRASPPQP